MSDKDANTETAEVGLVQRLLDGFHSLRQWLVTRLAFYSLRLYGLEDLTLGDVGCGSYSRQKHTDRKLENAKDLDALVAASRECLDNANNRRAAITDKCKTLLTMSSLLMGLVGFLLPKAFAFDATWMRVFGFLAMLALMNTITLLLIFFGVGRDSEVSLEQDDVDLDSENFKKSLINLYLRCQIDMDNRTNYLVDLYKAARFFALLAFAVFVALFSINFLCNSPRDQTKRIIRELRSDPALIELLRGPKGDEGEKGEQGDPGLQGRVRPKGERGQDATFDEERIIERLRNDPRLSEKFEEAARKQQVKHPSEEK